MELLEHNIHLECQTTKNPNNCAEEVGNPKYITNLLLNVINVSLLVAHIVESAPKGVF